MRAQLDGPALDSTPAPPTQEPAGERAIFERATFERAEVRDVLAWLRLLTEPSDAAAAVRALGRPPVELRQVDLARVVQIARRNRLDVVSALARATESPQLAPQARERIERFQELHRWAAAALERESAEVFVEQLIGRLGLRRRQLFAGGEREAEERFAGLEHLCQLVRSRARQQPPADARALLEQILATAQNGDGEAGAQTPGEEPAAAAALAPGEAREQELQKLLGQLREEVLADVTRIAEHLRELRLDIDLDISHGIVRYLELIKLAALREGSADRDLDEALADINARLLTALTPLQREIYESSPLDAALGELADPHTRASAPAPTGPRGEPSLAAFLPRRGAGLALSASDVETYRGCPLRYKFARVLKIPTEQTLNQRFGIVVHQVLERYHGAEERTLGLMMELLDAAWRRSGIREGELERRLRVKARAALVRYHERLLGESAQPLWFERSFAFALGPHQVRGRVDRVDVLPDGSYELIDYKTGHAKTAAELHDDVQLSLYAIAAREAWQLESSRQAYYYLLDDRRVPVPRAGEGEQWVREEVLRVGEAILAQRFEPTPAPAICALCDYRIVCPAAER